MGENLTVNEDLMLKVVHTQAQFLINTGHWNASEEDSRLVKLKKVLNSILAASRMTLDLYGVYHGTDKASFVVENNEINLGHDYLRHYEMLFSPFRFQEMLLVEFGCFRGDSLRMWQDYFPKADIVGVDIDESVKVNEGGRIHIVIGDAASRDTYDAVQDYAGKRSPFIILDDASHAWSDQRRSLEMFWEMLAPGGFYVIEDLECGSYGAYADYVPQVLDSQPFFDYIRDRCHILRWPAYDIGQTMDIRHTQLPKNISKFEDELDACLFLPGAIILRKR